MKTFCNIFRQSIKLAVLAAMCILFLSTTAFAAADSDEENGPGVIETVDSAPEASGEGTSLGIFSTTGYCNCTKCSSGSGLTYSGTVPQANHTISADISILPLGTRVRIGDIIYTVEDIGGGVDGHEIDIYYSSHDEAWAHGRSEVEVFLIEKPADKAAKDAPKPEAVTALKGPGDTVS